MSPLHRNPVFFLTWGLPAVAVIASVLTLVIALRGPDGQLPEQYHWEGFQLDRDFSRAARAAELKVRATVTGLDRSGPCELRLQMEGVAPDVLLLMLAHGTRADLDRRITFKRVPTEPGWSDGSVLFRGACTDLNEGHWRVELVDSVNSWAIRKSVRSSLGTLSLNAVTGNGG
jgi:uncharacterized protein